MPRHKKWNREEYLSIEKSDEQKFVTAVIGCSLFLLIFISMVFAH